MKSFYLFISGLTATTDIFPKESQSQREEGEQQQQQPILKEIKTDSGESWGFKGDHALAYSNLTHSYINTIPSEDHSYIYDPDEPRFDIEKSSNVTALLGKTAVLNCRVKNIGNRTVSTNF